jgi:nitrite reductase/ring-hydroxylating ferredoxin subunit
VKVAPVEDLPVGSSVSVTVEARKQTYLLHRRDEQTVLAYTAVCPHAGCQVHTAEEDFECPCHGSHFSLEDGMILLYP